MMDIDEWRIINDNKFIDKWYFEEDEEDEDDYYYEDYLFDCDKEEYCEKKYDEED